MRMKDSLVCVNVCVNVNLFDWEPLVKEEKIMITNDIATTCVSVVEKDKIHQWDIY